MLNRVPGLWPFFVPVDETAEVRSLSDAFLMLSFGTPDR